MNKQTIITILLALVTTTSVLAQNLIKTATTPVSFSKRDFADTIKIKVIDGAVVVPVEIEGRIRHFLFDTGSPLGLWQGQKETWMRQFTTDSLTFGDINKRSRNQIIYLYDICLNSTTLVYEKCADIIVSLAKERLGI